MFGRGFVFADQGKQRTRKVDDVFDGVHAKPRPWTRVVALMMESVRMSVQDYSRVEHIL